MSEQDRRGFVGRIVGVSALLVVGCAAGRGAAGQGPPPGDAETRPAPFVDDSTLDRRVPSPPSVIGHEVGETAVRYDALVRYLSALAEASDLVTMTPYARSHEGRTLYYLTITSRANHARLEAIKSDNARLADPRRLRGPQEGRRIIEELPAIAWMAYSIHGDELSSTDAAMQLAYQLAAGTDQATKRIRDEVVVHIDPL